MHTANDIRTATLAKAKTMLAENLAQSDEWVIRGLLAIFKRQTADEQNTEATKHWNEVGFNGLDAGILTSFAKQVIRWQELPVEQRRFDCPLSPKQLGLARRKMHKYCGQLVKIARESQPAALAS